MSVASALRTLRGIWGRSRASGPAARYDALSDRYVCRSGRHDADDPAELTCGCGESLTEAVAPVRPVVPAPRVELMA